MKFLIDEDVPVGLLKSLNALGHDCVRVSPSSFDRDVAKRAKSEERILITIDRDFLNVASFPPSKFDTILIQIHPPYANAIIPAFKRWLTAVSPKEMKGLTILNVSGFSKIAG